MFQSFLCWILLWKPLKLLSRLWSLVFQSFLCWILLWKMKLLRKGEDEIVVSILLMLDIALEVIPKSGTSSGTLCFNPSYAGYCSGSHDLNFQRSHAFTFQSFLCWILLWKLLKWNLTKKLSPCFNPSYAGYCSGRFAYSPIHGRRRAFQSFLCWILLWKCLHFVTVQKLKHLFQSFLCWILLWKLLLSFLQTLPCRCFNPSYAGYCSGSWRHPMNIGSCFRFNPSYAGYCSGRSSRYTSRYTRAWFQSFLCWILLWKQRVIQRAHLLKVFQSFLCWILLWKLAE